MQDVNTSDITALKPVVDAVLCYSQDYPFEELNTVPLLEKWYKAKSFLISAFGGMPIVRSSEKIRIELSEFERDKYFDEMIEQLDEEINLQVTAKNGVSFRDFLRSNKESFFDNRVSYSYPELRIGEGMKLLRCFKYFLPSFNVTRYAQDLASRYI